MGTHRTSSTTSNMEEAMAKFFSSIEGEEDPEKKAGLFFACMFFLGAAKQLGDKLAAEGKGSCNMEDWMAFEPTKPDDVEEADFVKGMECFAMFVVVCDENADAIRPALKELAANPDFDAMVGEFFTKLGEAMAAMQ